MIATLATVATVAMCPVSDCDGSAPVDLAELPPEPSLAWYWLTIAAPYLVALFVGVLAGSVAALVQDYRRHHPAPWALDERGGGWR